MADKHGSEPCALCGRRGSTPLRGTDLEGFPQNGIIPPWRDEQLPPRPPNERQKNNSYTF
jgi:hypothetical protein